MSSIISQENFITLLRVIDHNANKLKGKVKDRHLRKLTNMGGSKTSSEYINKDRWVINLSSRQLIEQEIISLQNGLNFATTPRSIPISRIVANIETGIYNLPHSSKAPIRVSILKNRKPETTNNISKQLAAIRNLKQDPSIVIVPADKGRATVVMNTAEYKEKVRALLKDSSTYMKITEKRRNPTSRVEKDLKKLLS